MSIKSPLGGGDDRKQSTERPLKLGTKRHILTDKDGIPLSAVMSSASDHDVKWVTGVVDNAVVKRHISSLKNKDWKKKENNIYAFIIYILSNLRNRNYSNEGMYCT